MKPVIDCLFIILFIILGPFELKAQSYIRINQAGYLPKDQKTAIGLANQKTTRQFQVIDAKNGQLVFTGEIQKSTQSGWGNFRNFYLLDFSELNDPGNYQLIWGNTKTPLFRIAPEVYAYEDDLLEFMRQQRCGYNPLTDQVCHQQDGRTFFGTMPDSTYLDASGGWHDAGDQLKYLITSSFATGAMLKAYQLHPEKFDDQFNALGQPGANQLPDVLDEAKWGLDWIHKLHPRPGQLFHQVADDRDHMGWKWPHQDNSDYGWGPNSYRPVYFATGKPQGLGNYKSEATGIANLAGRSAAAMALGYQVFKNFPAYQDYANHCLTAARDLYKMGREQEGYQQGNSYGAPYRYMENTWADDMEWAAAELYKATGASRYLEQAIDYAIQIGETSWAVKDSAAHYELYPFINLGHFALAEVAPDSIRPRLARYYQAGITYCQQRAARNIYQVGVPFIWCSNNLVAALITQIALYEKISGDFKYHDLLIAQRDWLFGRNPWGTSMFMNIPEEGEYPQDVHTSIWQLTRKEVPGGLVDGPIWRTIHNNLKGLALSGRDEFARFQNEVVIYHDDIGDYATNEPTMDGTAGAILMMVLLYP